MLRGVLPGESFQLKRGSIRDGAPFLPLGKLEVPSEIEGLKASGWSNRCGEVAPSQP